MSHKRKNRVDTKASPHEPRRPSSKITNVQRGDADASPNGPTGEAFGKAMESVLPASDPPEVVRREPRSAGGAGFPLVGSEVLEALRADGRIHRAMHDVIHAPDDDIVERHLRPKEEASVSFRPDHQLADAGAELAEDFGREFLMSATSGEDMSELTSNDETDPSEMGGPFIEEQIDDEDDQDDED